MAISAECLILLVALVIWTILEFVPSRIPPWVRSVLLAVVLWMLALMACGWLEIE